MYVRLSIIAALFALGACAAPSPNTPIDIPARRQEVVDVERAFAKTMADRDLAAFATFIAEDAIFMNDGKPLKGKAEIIAYWKRFYVKPGAPFAWEPEFVEVLSTGTLAQSTGPVTLPDGKSTSRYYSTWRREASGAWRIVFDDGYDVCQCAQQQ